MSKELTQEQLKELFDYNPETGILTRIVTISTRAAKGDACGCVSTGGYLQAFIRGKKELIHRVVWLYMTGSFPKGWIDHINGVKDDNRWSNLRQATQPQNARNRKLQKNNTSGVKGVMWSKSDKRWRAVIRHDGTLYNLGSFVDILEAKKVIMKKREELHGEFCNHG